MRRQDEEIAWNSLKLKKLKTKLKKRIREEESERRLAEICSLSPALDKPREGDNDKEDGNDELVVLSNNASNNAMMRQVANGFRLNQILWKLHWHWEKGILEWMRHRESIIIKTMTTLLLS